MSVHVFYHSADLDGMCSGAICKYFMPEAVLHGINYGEEFPWKEVGGQEVYMVDFSLQPFEDMLRLHNQSSKFVWIDHHISAMEDYWAYGQKTVMAGVRSVHNAACELCWQYFSPNSGLPLAVFWLGRYDIWRHSEAQGSLEFQYGMRLENTEPENQIFWEHLFKQDGTARLIADDGAKILRYEKEQNRKFAAAFCFETKLDGLRCIAANKGFTNSLVFESVYDEEKHDVMLSFAWRGGKWTVSLYATRPEIDVSVIAKARGGGGHKGAAGFQCDELPFTLR